MAKKEHESDWDKATPLPMKVVLRSDGEGEPPAPSSYPTPLMRKRRSSEDRESDPDGLMKPLKGELPKPK